MNVEPTVAEIETAARAVYEVEYPRYDPAAHPDHNRWSWVGDGNSEVVKDGYRAYAKAALTAVLPLVDARLRAEIAADIEAAAPPAEPEIGRALYGDDMYGNGMRAAARIARRGR